MSISIIGLGGMARALGALALEGGNAVEVIGRDEAKATDLARTLGNATTSTIGAVPAGDIVILAVPYASAVPIVTRYGNALSGKVIVDISNPFSPDFITLVTPDGSSAAREIAEAAPTDAHVVKAFNTLFATVLTTPGHRLDVLLAGDNAQAKKSVAEFVESLGMRALDTGPLEMARRLEEIGLFMMGLGHHGLKHYNFSLGILTPGNQES